jgi:hypothetical protein
LYAPLILNENTGCISSLLRKISFFRLFDIVGANDRGVSIAAS